MRSIGPTGSKRLALAVSIFIVCVLLAGIGCTAQFPTQPSTPGPPIGLFIRYPTSGFRLMVGDSISAGQMRAFTVDSERVYVDVTATTTWSTSNNQIMRPTIDGLGQPSRDWFLSGAGNVDLYATYKGLTATLPLTIRAVPPPPSLQIRRDGLGFRVTLVNTIGSQDVTSSVDWLISDPTVVSINAQGTLRQDKPGNVEIRASYNGLSDYFWMSVALSGQ